jgi:hypothetical protein
VAGRQDQAHIAFERSGGFTGISVHTDVDTAELSEAEAAEYRSMLTDLDLSALERPALERAGQPDRYQYDLSVQQGDRVYRMTYGETELPDELRPLVDKLTKRATRRQG